ncbi:uncharacterized protein LOC128884004 isoform X2 [Hylaeus volcanicus]|uniref:uncharacterized protein LOC128884004 isoform X2 n=1 Tax=Hylaeus volcanicus TaxID=313075 RepID=UPI0023B7C300|nr:uncharacterized protein LOC128884004 isoform X2 [Hylaeus volcanicus]
MQSSIVENTYSSQPLLFNIDCDGDANLKFKTREGKLLHTSKYASCSKRSSTNASSTFFNFPVISIEGPSLHLPKKYCRVEDTLNHTLTQQDEKKSFGFESLSDVSLVASPGTMTPFFPKKKSIEEGEIVESNFFISPNKESTIFTTNNGSSEAQDFKELNYQTLDKKQTQDETIIDTSSSSESIIVDSFFFKKTNEIMPPLQPPLHDSITSLENEISLTSSPLFFTTTRKRKNPATFPRISETSPTKSSCFSSQEQDFIQCIEKEQEEKKKSFLFKDHSKEKNKQVTVSEQFTAQLHNTREAYFGGRDCKRIKRSLSCSEKHAIVENSASECLSSDSDISDTDKTIFKTVLSDSVKTLNCVEIDQECAWKVWTLQNNLHERFPLSLKRVVEPKMSSRPLRSVRYTTLSNIVEVSPSFWIFSKRKVGMKEYNFFIAVEELAKHRIMMNHPLEIASKQSNSISCRKCGAIHSQRNEYHNCPRIRCNNCGRMGHKRNSCNEKDNKSCIPHYMKNFFDITGI